MMFNRTLPQVFARLLVVQTNVLASLVVVFDHNQGQLLLLEVELANFGPEEQPDLLDALEHEDAGGRRQSQVIFAAIFAL